MTRYFAHRATLRGEHGWSRQIFTFVLNDGTAEAIIWIGTLTPETGAEWESLTIDDPGGTHSVPSRSRTMRGSAQSIAPREPSAAKREVVNGRPLGRLRSSVRMASAVDMTVPSLSEK